MLPTRARRLRIPLLLHGSRLDIDIQPQLVTYSLRNGNPVTAVHHGTRFTVTTESPASFPGDYRTHDSPP
jgi:alpha,alpha-trehalose phosphorylase